MQEVLRHVQKELKDIVIWLKSEVSSLRTGRATPALVEDIEVEYYGARNPLKHIASLSTPDSRTIIIQPWDKTALDAIAKAVETSSLNLQPIIDGEGNRISFPQPI